MHRADGTRRLVEAQPEAIARLALANDVVLRRLAPADDTGLERLFFDHYRDRQAIRRTEPI